MAIGYVLAMAASLAGGVGLLACLSWTIGVGQKLRGVEDDTKYGAPPGT